MTKGSVDFNDNHVEHGIEKTKAVIIDQVKQHFEGNQGQSANDNKGVLPPGPNVWRGEPNEMKQLLPPVLKLNDDMLPAPLMPWLTDITHRMQAPIDFSASAMLIVFGSVIGAGCRICPKKIDNWGVTPNLFGIAIGEPSVLKSPAQAEVLKLLEVLQFKYRDIYEREKTDLEFDEMMSEGKLKQLQADIKKVTSAEKLDGDTVALLKEEYRELSEDSTSATRRLFKTNETSIQSMTELQKMNPRGILMHIDEAMGLFNMLEMPQNADLRAYIMQGWNGFGAYVDYKVGRGLTEAANICLSLIGTTQPDKIEAYVLTTKQGGNDGQIQRNQLSVWPDNPSKWENVDQKPDTHAKDRAYKILEYLAEVDFMEIGAHKDSDKGTPYFRFNSAGQRVFDTWLNDLMTVKLKYEDNPLMVQHLSKYRSLMPSIALIFHLIDIADGSASNDGVSETAASLAVLWCDYLSTHARKIYSISENREHAAAVLLSLKITEGRLSSPFKPQDVYRKCWHGLKDKTEVKAACVVLVDENWLYEYIPPKPKTGRTPASQYFIHPSLVESK